MQKGYKFLVDSREKPKTLAIYDLKSIPYEVEALQADVVLRKVDEKPFRNVVGIEKKRWDDLYQAITTRPNRHEQPRFFKQIDKLVAYHDHPMVVIFGDLAEIQVKISKYTKFNKNRIWGTLASIAARSGVEIYCFPDETDAIEFSFRYCEKVSEGKFRERKSKLPKYKRFHPSRALRLVPGITADTAKKLLDKYGCLRYVGRAARKHPGEVKTIKGMGEHQVKNLNRMMNEKWE